MNADFRIDFITHDDYEYLAAEISFQGQRVCQMFRPAEGDVVEIEIIEDRLLLPCPVLLRFPLSQFLEIVEIARGELMALKL